MRVVNLTFKRDAAKQAFMGRTYCTESGRMLLHANEEVARWRRVRKRLHLPASARTVDADVWLCVCGYPRNREPLDVRVNGRRVARLEPPGPGAAGAWAWRSIRAPKGTLRGGVNEIVLACDSSAMSAWMLGVETGHRDPASALSTDRGQTWSADHMGAAGVLRGEYLVRVRLHGPRIAEQSPPPIVYEDARHPRVRALRELVPARVRNIRDPWKQVLALRTWVARAWTYEAFGSGYSPWDPWTILAWTRGDWGHGRPKPIAMCVHYGMTFTSLAASLGRAARGLAVTEAINGPNGHFMSEVWDRGLGKWVAHDPNFDLHYEADGRPLSGVQLADRAHAGRSAPSDMRRGPGFTSNCPRLNGLLNDKLATGEAFAAVAVWRRNDVVSDPAGAPPNHGSVVYCETDLVWYAPHDPRAAQTEMFPHRVREPAYFDAPPTKPRGGRA